MPGPLTVSLPNDTDILVVRSFDSPRALVWRCFNEPALVRRWLLGPDGWTMPECEIDLRVGGRFRYVWAHPDGRRMQASGEYHVVEPCDLIVHRERFDEDWGDPEGSLVTTTFVEKHGCTVVAMTMSFPSQAKRDAATATGMTDGMEESYARLDAILAALETARAE